MFILFTLIELAGIAFFLVIISQVRARFRYTWLIAVGGAFLAWVNVFSWRGRLPLSLVFPPWEPAALFHDSLSFTVNAVTWPFVFSLATFLLATILTAIIRENFPAPLPWAASFVLGGLGLLAVMADNPVTLLMVWAAIDFAELLAHLRQQEVGETSDKIVTVFAVRLSGIGMLFWASMVSLSSGTPLNFQDPPPQAGLFLLISAGLRLGVLPLHLPYVSEINIRRGFGSMLRLVSAASSLIILARIPRLDSPLGTTVLLTLSALAATYAGWKWYRSSDELSGRPFWLIGCASLAIVSSLSANPLGAIGWGCGLILSGGVLFLTSVYRKWVNRLLLLGWLGLSALPFTITAMSLNLPDMTYYAFWPFLILAQACLLAGYAHHAVRPSGRVASAQLDRVSLYAFYLGVAVLMTVLLLLGIWGWDGAFKVGNVTLALLTNVLAILLVWLANRLPAITPFRANWLRPEGLSIGEWFFRILSGIYQLVGRIASVITDTLEGEGGIMWTILLLVSIISLLTQGSTAP